jgi:Ser/Thr protein kinase RdoA (MazF antagonist)
MPDSFDRRLLALQAYGIVPSHIEPLGQGNINDTYLVHDGARSLVLQRLNPLFSPLIHLDIEAVTAHLEARGMRTPRLCKTLQGALWVDLAEDNSIWRLQTLMPGHTFEHAPCAALCAQAGALLGRFHRALSDFTAPFAAPTRHVHDTASHLAGLQAALMAHPDHVALPELQPIADGILAAAHSLPSLLTLRAKVVHGDPKLSNMLFLAAAEAYQGVAVVDLDTLNRFSVVLELGDGLRSWCNPLGENDPHSHFSPDFFAAALRGYAAQAGTLLTGEEIALLPYATETIALELAARFARDTLEERYFRWDTQRYAAAWQHNLQRTRSQYALAVSAATQRNAVRTHLQTIFAGQSL